MICFPVGRSASECLNSSVSRDEAGVVLFIFFIPKKTKICLLMGFSQWEKQNITRLSVTFWFFNLCLHFNNHSCCAERLTKSHQFKHLILTQNPLQILSFFSFFFSLCVSMCQHKPQRSGCTKLIFVSCVRGKTAAAYLMIVFCLNDNEEKGWENCCCLFFSFFPPSVRQFISLYRRVWQ